MSIDIKINNISDKIRIKKNNAIRKIKENTEKNTKWQKRILQ